jgi:riboflavin synthase
MFTGLVEEKATLVARRASSGGAVLHIRCTLRPLVLGESIAVDGACLTVVRLTPDGFEADASPETLERTTLGTLPVNAPVNLERSVALGARLGGHLVSGHVDGTTTLVSRKPTGNALGMTFAVDTRLARFIAEKGSVAVNGVSLTVNAVADRPPTSTFDVVIIPHTQEMTSLDRLTPGAKANIEVDLVARYVARLQDTRELVAAGPGAGVGPSSTSASADDAFVDRLRKSGYV